MPYLPNPNGTISIASRDPNNSTTWGTLGFLCFEPRPWTVAEINALKSVASMLVQLQGRIDAAERKFKIGAAKTPATKSK